MATDWRDSLRSLMTDAPGNDTVSEPEATGADAAALPPCPPLCVSMERKGRGGKTATIIYGFPDGYPDEEIARVASELRRRLGTGGSARGGEILLQGDRRADVADALAKMNYKCRKC